MAEVPCPSCASLNGVGARFCGHCGERLPGAPCPSCGAGDQGGHFCQECGAALTAGTALRPAPSSPDRGVRVSRKVTSVLFGDLVGFTSLSESRDIEDVRDLQSRYFQTCRRVIARYGGTVEKFIGDAVMAVWGVPTIHEDDAERSVRAGLELTASIAALGTEVGAIGLAMRVGIVTGEVAVTEDAAGEGMVTGDAVNTAARVQSEASPGRVWVDEATRQRAGAAIDFTDAGRHSLKGKSQQLQLHEARAVVAGIGGADRMDGLLRFSHLVPRSSDVRTRAAAITPIR